MFAANYSLRRIEAALEEVEQLKQSEFPYKHSSEALMGVEQVLTQRRDGLRALSPSATPMVAHTLCRESLAKLILYLPILGFILRSTNIRNAFEVYSPLLRLVRMILGPSAKLLLSSEWDYSPFVYFHIYDLPEFVMIGIPASESANPLLIPLAGHEIGHSVWRDMALREDYREAIEQSILNQIRTSRWGDFHQLYPHYDKEALQADLVAQLTWRAAYTWAMLQTEETFCDILGLRVFAEAYLHALAYLVSPRPYDKRTPIYPNIKRRVEHLLQAARHFGVEVSPDYSSNFEDEEPLDQEQGKLLCQLADVASSSVVNRLISNVEKLASQKAMESRSSVQVEKLCKDFEKVVPASKAYTLVDIVNAGWRAYHKRDLWSEIPQIKETQRDRILRDIVLKSIEVSEIFARVKL